VNVNVAVSPASVVLADLACERGGLAWLTALACDSDPEAVLLAVLAPDLCEQVLARTGEGWRAEVETHVDLFVAGQAEDVVRATCSAGWDPVLDHDAVLEELLADLAAAAVAPENVWLT
jgi:hypothetical protein